MTQRLLAVLLVAGVLFMYSDWGLVISAILGIVILVIAAMGTKDKPRGLWCRKRITCGFCERHE